MEKLKKMEKLKNGKIKKKMEKLKKNGKIKKISIREKMKEKKRKISKYFTKKNY